MISGNINYFIVKAGNVISILIGYAGLECLLELAEGMILDLDVSNFRS